MGDSSERGDTNEDDFLERMLATLAVFTVEWAAEHAGERPEVLRAAIKGGIRSLLVEVFRLRKENETLAREATETKILIVEGLQDADLAEARILACNELTLRHLAERVIEVKKAEVERLHTLVGPLDPAISDDEVSAEIRAAGGDPEAIGKRGEVLAEALIKVRRLTDEVGQVRRRYGKALSAIKWLRKKASAMNHVACHNMRRVNALNEEAKQLTDECEAMRMEKCVTKVALDKAEALLSKATEFRLATDRVLFRWLCATERWSIKGCEGAPGGGPWDSLAAACAELGLPEKDGAA